MLPPHSFIVEKELGTSNASLRSPFPAKKVTANQEEPQGSTALLHLFFRPGTQRFLQSALPRRGPPPLVTCIIRGFPLVEAHQPGRFVAIVAIVYFWPARQGSLG